ncbi:MAG: hypothetical protein JNK05_34950 [Myxococcales bacterium]|nr:hypothetical protein [Myxococcales bacterium]
MSDLTVGGVPVLRGDFLLPRVGAWTADLSLDGTDAPSGVVAVESSAGFRALGFVERVSVTEGRVDLRIRGGQGQLGRELAPVAYRPVGGVRVRTILEDLARDSGEVLSPDTAREITDTFLPAWSRERGTTARALRAIAAALGCSWRFDPEGRFILVRESWPEVDPDGVTLLRSDPINDAAELGLDAMPAALVPGVTWQGRRVSSIEAFALDGGALRMRLLFEREDQPIARDRIALKYNVQRVEEIEASVYLGTYLARVVAQSTDLATVDVELEPDVEPEKKKLAGLVRVPLYGSVPGMVLEIDSAPGGEPQLCVVGFLNGDRAKPFVVSWLGSTNANGGKRARKSRVRGQTIELGEGGARNVARNNDPTGSGTIVFTSLPGAPPANPKLQIVYTPPSGAPQTVTLDMPGGVTGSGTLTISGTITDGSPFVKTD